MNCLAAVFVALTICLSVPQSTQSGNGRFWRTFHHEGKIAWLVRVGGARPPPFTTITITSKVAVYASAEGADTLTLFHLYQYISVVCPSVRLYSMHVCTLSASTVCVRLRILCVRLQSVQCTSYSSLFFQ
jgi:hypothetical protein